MKLKMVVDRVASTQDGGQVHLVAVSKSVPIITEVESAVFDEHGHMRTPAKTTSTPSNPEHDEQAARIPMAALAIYVTDLVSLAAFKAGAEYYVFCELLNPDRVVDMAQRN